MTLDSKSTRQKLLCGFDSLDLSQGGIARVGRLVWRVISDPSVGLVKPEAIVYRDVATCSETAQLVCAGKSKVRYLLAINRAAFRHSHFFYDVLGMARAHGVLPRLLRRPYACFVHGIEAWPGEWARSDRVQVARNATMLIANSEFTRMRAADLDPTFSRAKTCWLATEDDELPRATSAASGPPRILIIGRLEEDYKGHQQLIRCWSTVLSAVPDAILTVVGRGPRMDEFRQLAQHSGVGSAVEFRGFVTEKDLPELWRQTAVFAMPSRGEGFGLTYIEAMRYGVPVIASIHDAGSEVNVHGVTGYNVDLDRPDDLPDRIIQLFRNRDHAATLGANGRLRWAEHFRFSAFRDRFLPILREFLNH